MDTSCFSFFCGERRGFIRIFSEWWWALLVVIMPVKAHAGAFHDYTLATPFQLPSGAGLFDTLPDGRLVTVAGDEILLETGAGTRTFASQGTVSGADFSSFGPMFFRVSPDGTKLAIGNSGGASFQNFQVGVFDLATLSGGWLQANHFDATWTDNTHLALTAGVFGQPSFVSLLDTTSTDPTNPNNPVVIDHIGGASGGIALDTNGNLYTGNGFATTGPSGTGAIKEFDQTLWTSAINGGPSVNFETAGTTIVDVLSASSLGFDAEGNLFVGGGEFGGPDVNFAALVNRAAIDQALNGLGPVDAADPNEVRRLDPDSASDFNFYDVRFNAATGELYLRDGTTVYPFVVPEPCSLILLAIGAASVAFRRRLRGRPGMRVPSNVRTGGSLLALPSEPTP